MKKKQIIPKLSIITASFNQARFIERTILSVIEQNHSNTELIIIDGGSTDNTLEILNKYDDKIIYWISEPDNGQTDAINKGFKHATGDFVCFQNSDDIFLPGTFDKFVSAMNKNPKKDLFYGNFKHIDSNDNILDIQKLMPTNFFLQVFKGPLIHNQACFWKRDIFDKIGMLDETYKFDLDYEFFTRVLFYGYKSYFINDFLGALRHHELTKTSNLGDVSKAEMARVKTTYKSKSFVTKVIPLNLGKWIGTLCKVTYHILNNDINYLSRKRYKFK